MEVWYVYGMGIDGFVLTFASAYKGLVGWVPSI